LSTGADQCLLAQVAGRLHDAELELRPDHGGDPQGVVGVVRQAGEPAAHDFPDSFGNAQFFDGQPRAPALLSSFDGAGLDQVAEHLPDEERVAFRLLVDGPSQGVPGFVEGTAGGLFDDGRHADVIQAAERQPLHTALAAEVGHDLDQRMVVREFGVPVGAEDEDAPAAGPDDVAEQQQRRLGRPLEVVEHQQHRFVGRGGREPGRHSVEEAIPLGVGV
jgi:hypothetical protein